jgi:hypothetical protein
LVTLGTPVASAVSRQLCALLSLQEIPVPEQLVVRRADDPSAPIARETRLVAATDHAVREARRTPGAILEVLEPATGRICLRVRVDRDGHTVLVQRPTTSAGDAWPDPPAWLPFAASA